MCLEQVNDYYCIILFYLDARLLTGISIKRSEIL